MVTPYRTLHADVSRSRITDDDRRRISEYMAKPARDRSPDDLLPEGDEGDVGDARD